MTVGRRGAADQFLLRHVELQQAARHVEHDRVAVLDECEQATGCGLRRDVQHDGAVGRTAHPPSQTRTMSRIPISSIFRGNGRLATSGMPG